MPKISVVMSIYKEPVEWLRQSIDSILNQTYSDFEYIILNDKPDREENNILLFEYSKKDTRIKVICNHDNIGLTKSLNRGFAAAQGEYIARMDADDISLSRRFERQVKYLDSNKDVIALGTGFQLFGKVAFKHFVLYRPVVRGDSRIKAHFLFENCMAHSSMMIRKSILDENQIIYDENYSHSQDYRLWEILIRYGKFDNLKYVLLKYRLSEQQITNIKSGSQINLADSVRNRLHIKWLDSLNINYSQNDLKYHPSVIIAVLKKDKNIKRTFEYRMFFRYVYLKSKENLSIIDALKTGDIWSLSLIDVLRLFLKSCK